MLLIKHGRVISPTDGLDGNYDILAAQSAPGRIVRIAPAGGITPESCPEFAEALRGAQIVDAAGLLVLPGLVDVHVHFREPGFTYKEEIATGAKAAARGGVTTVVLMANTKPAVDNPDTLAYVLEKGRATDIHVETCVNVTKGMKGQELVDVEDLVQKGAVGITDDGIPLLNAELVRRAMELSARLDVPVSFHEENPAYIENNGINHGKASEYFGIGGSDRQAEVSLVERDLKLALETGAIMNVQHISTKEAVELVRLAKSKPGGERIHAEATPHHFTLTEMDAIRYGTMAKMNPPLREEEDRQAILAGIADGTIDIIATDHAPHSAEEKQRPLTEAPSGIIGLETALALANEILVQGGYLDYAGLVKAMSTNPARMYRLDAGCLKEGGPADFVLFDPKRRWVVEEFASKSCNSPFLGREMVGQVLMTICGGRVIYTASYDEGGRSDV